MSDLVVRAYNVGFGDAVLVSVPERSEGGGEVVRHLLLDVGNLLAGSANEDTVFRTVVTDIADRTGGIVDLYVMTHEHLDHVQGLLAAAKAGVGLSARYAWLTGSAAPDYYERHPKARKRKLGMQMALADAIRRGLADDDPELELTIRNNMSLLPSGVLGLSTSDYVDHVRALAPADRTFYVDRTTAPESKHPFTEAVIRILAPEADTSDYYRRAASGGSLTASAATTTPEVRSSTTLTTPPPGVDPGAFFDLLRERTVGSRRRIMEIDAANNNTSVVIEIEWRGWRLLFPGDAELSSWRRMREQGLLRPAHFIKVAHHGSSNGTDVDVIDDLFPTQPADNRPRHALVSTATGSWESVPSADTLAIYQRRCTLHDTRDVARGSAVEVAFAG